MQQLIMKFYSLILINLLVISCSSSSDRKLVLLQNNIFSNDDKMAILKDTADVSLVADKIFKIWEPSENDFGIINSILTNAIQEGEFDFLKDPTLQKIYDHYRQYICYKNNDGDNMIYINALCIIPEQPIDVEGKIIVKPFDWENRLLVVHEGGPCFWNMTINMTARTFSNVRSNGY